MAFNKKYILNLYSLTLQCSCWKYLPFYLKFSQRTVTYFLFAGTRKGPPVSYRDGPMPTISDSLFSLIILIYVGVIFVFMFFAFCWKEPEPPPPDPAHKNIPMITSMLDEMEKQEAAEAAKLAEQASLAAEQAKNR